MGLVAPGVKNKMQSCMDHDGAAHRAQPVWAAFAELLQVCYLSAATSLRGCQRLCSVPCQGLWPFQAF